MSARRLLWLGCVVLGLLWSLAGHAATLTLLPEESGRSLQPAVELWQDDGRQATLADALARGQFAPVAPSRLTPGYSRAAYWLRTRLYNPGPAARTVWVEIGSPRLQDIAFYQWQGGRWQVRQAGLLHPYASWPLATTSPTFPVTLAPGERRDIVWRVASRSAMSMVPRLWSPETLRAEEASTNLVRGVELGSLTVLGLYSLMLFFSLGQRGYAFHGVSALTFVVYELGMTGLGVRYLWPDATWLATRLISLSINISLIAFLLFFREFLETRTHMPRWDRFMVWLMGGLVVSTVLSQLVDYTTGAQLGTQLGLLITVALPLFCFWSLVRGPATSWAYTIATFTISLGNLTRVLENLGLRAPDRFSAYGVPLAGVLCTFLLLVAFTQQMRRVRRQKDQATETLLAFREKERAELEQMVATRTAELEAARRSAEQANQAKTALLAHISHDLRAPLSTIIGYARRLPAGEALAESRRAIEKNARHQLELVDELIDHARVELGELTLHPAPGYWHAFVDGLAGDAQQLARQHDNRFVLSQDAELPPVLCTDFKRLRQVLVNLIANAAKFTRHGTLGLSIRRVDSGTPDTVTLAFIVYDTGIGMSADTLARLFRPFERGDNAAGVQGSGLGLSIAQNLVRALGGELSVESQLGEGSRFAFRLVLAVGDEATLLAAQPVPAAEPSCWSAPASRSLTVLVADDVVDSLALTAHGLRCAGHRVLEARDGDEALALLAGQPVDLVVCDQRMPGRDGWGVLQGLHQRGTMLPVLLYSAEPPQRPAGFPVGLDFDAALLKPADPDQLLECIAALLAARQQAGEPLRPDQAELAALRSLVDTGQISAIEQWAAGLAERQPDCAGFAWRVGQAAAALDMSRLQDYCAG